MRASPRSSVLVCFLGFVILLFRAPTQCADAKRNLAAATTPAPISLLEEAERTSRNFIPEDRSSLLLEVAQSALSIDQSRAQTWALQLFAFSRTSLDPGHYREAMEKNALTVLARIDPVRAARMFRQLDLPDVKEFPNEDVRAFAAGTLFQELWNKKRTAALPKIEELANWLGSTGQYPYPAIASLILEVSQGQKDKSSRQTTTATLFSEAISYLPRDPGYLNTNRNFTNAILKVRTVVSASLLRQAITEDIAAIERRKDLRKGSSRFVVSSATTGSHTFDSEGPVLVYQLLPLISQIDPDWASRVKAQFGMADVPTPGLGEPLIFSGAITPPGQEQPASDAELQVALNDSRLFKSEQLSSSDPKAAVQLAQQITDPALRSVALVSAAPAYSKLDPNEAATWVSGAKEQLNSLPAGTKKLELMIALIKVSIANGKQEDAQQQLGRIYDLGEELFEEDVKANPGKFSEMADGYNELVDLTSVAARQSWLSGEALDHVRQLRNDVLRARLLVEEAKGITEQRHVTG